ncbi:MAG: glucosyl-3-phosphoglycerate synthase [Gordonia sp. (in: high G+C Gram-positive bacteria)]
MSGVPSGVEAGWSHTHTWDRPTWTVDELVAAKDGRTVSVVLPALDEQDTVAGVIASIAPLLGGLVDELLVLDSGSTDDTAAVARRAGARVVTREEALPGVEPVPGKGEALWRALAATSGDLVAFVDSDLIDPDPMFVPKMLGPLLTRPGVHLVKGYYRRPLRTSSGQEATGGGRVTELMARPLLTALKPELGEVIQPLGGEYAGTRELLTSVPFAAGYGVEIGLLVDTCDRHGLTGIGQVNLGVRAHRNRPLADLSLMSRQIIATLLRRCGLPDSGAGLIQFTAAPDGSFSPHVTELVTGDRPPIAELLDQLTGGDAARS